MKTSVEEFVHLFHFYCGNGLEELSQPFKHFFFFAWEAVSA